MWGASLKVAPTRKNTPNKEGGECMHFGPIFEILEAEKMKLGITREEWENIPVPPSLMGGRFDREAERREEQSFRRYIENFFRSHFPERAAQLDREGVCRCFAPHRHKNGDRNPSMGFIARDHRFHCFGCGGTFDLYDLVGIAYGLTDYQAKVRKVLEIYGSGRLLPPHEEGGRFRSAPSPSSEQKRPRAADTPERVKARLNHLEYLLKHETSKDSRFIDYLKSRGISAETAQEFDVIFDPEAKVAHGEPWQAVLFVTNVSNASYAMRNIKASLYGASDHRNRYQKRGAGPFLFNAERGARSTVPLVIVEGYFDGLAVCEAERIDYKRRYIHGLGGGVIALGTTANEEIFEALKGRSLPVILSLDSDSSGREFEAKLAGRLHEMGIPFICENLADLGPHGTFKDPADAWNADHEAFIERLNRAREKARKAVN